MSDYNHYLNRPFVEGVQDCYGLVREWYQNEMGLALSNYARPNRWWKVEGLNLIEELFEEEGFELHSRNANNVAFGDGLLICVGANVVNHVAVYIGDNQILHQPGKGVSRIEPYRPWRGKVVSVVRHQSKMQRKPQSLEKLLELVPAHMRSRFGDEFYDV